MLVEGWLERAARTRPDREAVNGVSYAQLRAAAARACGVLRERGVAAGDLVGIALPPGTDFVVALHAVWGAGAVAVPVDLRLGSDERAHVQRGCRVVVEEPLAGGDPAPLAGTHDLDAPAAIIHTSGSTGAPKPVELTFGNWLWSALGSGVALGVDPHERWLCPLPLTHVGGLSIVVRSAIYGTTAIVHERWDTERVVAALADATLVSLVPTTLARVLDAGLREPPRLRTVLLGGAPIPPALARRARDAGVPVTETYGLTEACSQVTTGGPPLFCTRVEIAHDGEILVSGPTVAGGGVLHTGDLGRLDERGHLHVVGRKADTIVTGGENVAPTEVEAVLAEHPAVAEAAVHARPDPEWGEAVVATIVLRPGAQATAEELRAHAAARLAGFKVPKAIAFADALPRTRSGKLLRRAL
ncbi:MAG TPA: AMP-binding protein [Capillimicrobium sp.]|nr:AMP-binding protein [Capillimicrobium sp.]